MMEVNIPENLENLKRPALQKLCKRLGLKANGKNVDMIKSLQEYKSQASSSSDDVCVAEEPPVTTVNNLETPPQSPSELPKKKKKGKRRKRGSKQSTSQEQGQACSENTPPETLPAVPDNSHNLVESAEPVAESPEMDVMVGEVTAREPSEAGIIATYPSPPVTETDNVQNPRKRKRRDTYSISPPRKQPRASVNSSPLPGCKIASESASQSEVVAKEIEPAPVSPPESTGPPATRKRRDTFSVSPSSSVGRTCTTASTETKESEPAPISPPESTDAPANHKRRDTFSISSSSPASCDCSTATKSTDHSVVAAKEGNPVSTSLPEMISCPVNHKRRDTFSISPPSSNHAPTPPTVKPNSEDNGKIQSEIMDLLQKRVEDRKADPNYRPVFGGTEASNTSRIPVKSVTASKFERAHKKQFKRMTSIVDHQKQKEKRAAEVDSRGAGMSAKKPRLHVAENVASSRSAIPKPRIPKPPQTFKPTVLCTQNMTLNFRLGADKQPKVSKTPGKPFVFSSQKKTIYKRHSGKLPEFKFSLY